MSKTCNLSDKHCAPCNGEGSAYSADSAREMINQLDSDWQLSETGDFIEREFKFKGFAKAVYFTNLMCWLADQEGHHPDISMGWGYCRIRFTTHELGGLSENDFICAAKVDALVSH